MVLQRFADLQHELIARANRVRGSEGRGASACMFCGGRDIRIYKRVVRRYPDLPVTLIPFEQELWRRDNGYCRSCGLHQSFYRFSEKGRHAIYAEGLDFDSQEFKTYPFPAENVAHIDRNAVHRTKRWREFFETQGWSTFDDVLHLRFYLGTILDFFRREYGSRVHGVEVFDNFERHVRENKPYITLIPGDLYGRIDLQTGGQLFDLVISFHNLVHSVDLRADLEALRTLLKPNGKVLFADEISRKPGNPFHMIHFDEPTFVKVVSSVFPQLHRIDDCGERSSFVTDHTLKGDSPDYVAWA